MASFSAPAWALRSLPALRLVFAVSESSEFPASQP
jgi:hypothetical protein